MIIFGHQGAFLGEKSVAATTESEIFDELLL